MPILVEPALAKINLTLRVLGRMPDGYHAIESLVAFADVGERVSMDVDTIAPGAAVSVRCVGPFAAAIDGANLVETATRAVLAHAPAARIGTFRIDKRLPVAAGLGGGSADAAAALRLVRRANPSLGGLPWHDIARGIGADVPVCLRSRPALMWGRGEHLADAPPLPPAHVVLVNARRPVPRDKTAAVFRRLAAAPLSQTAVAPMPHASLRLLPPAPDPLPPLGSAADLAGLVRTRGNDLLAPALATMPEIADVLAALAATNRCLVASLSGAGPTCFGLFPDAASADDAGRAVTASEPDWWVAASALTQA